MAAPLSLILAAWLVAAMAGDATLQMMEATYQRPPWGASDDAAMTFAHTNATTVRATRSPSR